MTVERPFRNSIALSFLLIGIALVFYSIGGVLEFVANIATFSWAREDVFDAAFRLIVLTVAFAYFFIGLSLIRTRPQYGTANHPHTPEPVNVAAPGALTAARLFSCILFLLGLILLFDVTPYGRNPIVAAVLLLSGIFGYAATVAWRRADPNVSAVAGVLAVIAGGLLLYGQLAVPLPDANSNTYGAWETTNLVMPPVLGPIAMMVLGVAGVVYAYVRSPKAANVSFLVLALAGLVYGIGLVLVALASVFTIPWYDFASVRGSSMLQMLAMTAGTALLVAGGVACIVAALVSMVRAGNNFKDASAADQRTAAIVTTSALPTRTDAAVVETTREGPVTTTTTNPDGTETTRTESKVRKTFFRRRAAD